jgi:hypothetical protein
VKYRPSNGTEGCAFYANWCENCARDKPMSEGKDYDECDDSDVCQLIADSLHYDINHPKYPKEWTYDKDGHPCCTAFVESGNLTPASSDCKPPRGSCRSQRS